MSEKETTKELEVVKLAIAEYEKIIEKQQKIIEKQNEIIKEQNELVKDLKLRLSITEDELRYGNDL